MRLLVFPDMARAAGRTLAMLCFTVGGLTVATNFNGARATNVLEDTTETIALETNRGVLIRLDRPANDIFVANPSIADVQVKSPLLIYIYGTTVGETTFYALDGKGVMIYSAAVSVGLNLTKLERTLREILPGTDISVRGINDMIILSGNVTNPDESSIAQRMAEQIAGNQENVINRIEISTPTQVNLRVKIAEIGRGTLKQLGFNWENVLYQGDNAFFAMVQGADVFNLTNIGTTANPVFQKTFNTANAGSNSFVGNISGGRFDLNTVIDALDNEGYLSVLAEPNLTTISGETANFLAGGEFPIPVPTGASGGGGGGGGQFTVQFKQFGVSLDFTPTVLSDQKINLKVSPEVSQLSTTGAITVNGISIPALSTRRVSTTVELASGQSFAIAGLLSETINHDVSKYPGLGDIPILGALFRSNRFQRQETELVVIVTPYIVRPFDAKRVVLPTDGMTQPSDIARYLKAEAFTARPRPTETPAESSNGITLAGNAGFRLKK